MKTVYDLFEIEFRMGYFHGTIMDYNLIIFRFHLRDNLLCKVPGVNYHCMLAEHIRFQLCWRTESNDLSFIHDSYPVA